jgi:hypothetical protein
MYRQHWLTMTSDLAAIYGDPFIHAHLDSPCDLPNYSVVRYYHPL